MTLSDIYFASDEGPPRVRFPDARVLARERLGPSTIWTTEAPGDPTICRVGERSSVVLLGRLYHYRQAWADSNVLLDRFHADWEAGAARPEELSGAFVIVIIDPQHRRVHVWTDHVGSRYVYLHKTSRRLGTYSRAVYGSDDQLDWVALAGMFGFGFMPGLRTHLMNVELLPPATESVFDESGRRLETTRYWDVARVFAQPAVRDQRAAVDGFVQALRTVVGGHTTRPCLLPISGGIDSRSIAAAVPSAARSTTQAYSYGYSRGSRELRISRNVARSLGIPFESVVVEPYVLDRLPQIMALNEGFADLTQTRQVSLWGRFPRLPVLAGHWGDVWTDLFGLEHLTEPELLRAASRKFNRRGNDWLLETLVRPHLANSPTAALDAELATGLERFAHLPSRELRFRLFKLETWGFRWAFGSLKAYAPVGAAVVPYLDPLIMNYLATLDPALFAAREIQVRAIQLLSPGAARIEWQESGMPLVGASLRHQPIRLLRRVQFRLSRERQQNWQVQFGSPALRRRVRDRMLDNARLGAYLPRAPLERLLADFDSDERRRQSWYSVTMLFTFALWLEGL